MNKASSRLVAARSILAAMVLLVAASGCVAAKDKVASPSAVGQVAGAPGPGQPTFPTTQAAADALLAAVRIEDADQARAQVHTIFGPAWLDILSGDPVEDARGFKNFVRRASERIELNRDTDAKFVLHLGAEDWPFPIPIVRAADGTWFLDSAAGKEELLARRIGANELAAIKVCRTYVQAQREYASKDRDGSDVLKFAQRFRSRPGHKDGLYWEAAAGEELSPLGPLLAEASLQGYALDQKGGATRTPYVGYYFHVLKEQGPAAPGGRYSYVINGHMIAGFALVACPDRYRASGVMTLIVNHRGRVYQKDLGPDTLAIVAKMAEYNPDETWTLVQD